MSVMTEQNVTQLLRKERVVEPVIESAVIQKVRTRLGGKFYLFPMEVSVSLSDGGELCAFLGWSGMGAFVGDFLPLFQGRWTDDFCFKEVSLLDVRVLMGSWSGPVIAFGHPTKDSFVIVDESWFVRRIDGKS